ncbi:hypothetical protein EV182_002652 [Spiromyces aspiralis]|uniref:Uncharacterized protein n=1 Tax=Spiromyces aspiralis TaxID=68401 RepID=A0ACC1HSY1_9FUNG|nr:hypothetical protein EV182_002652 [Spiromyces aspiralis]
MQAGNYGYYPYDDDDNNCGSGDLVIVLSDDSSANTTPQPDRRLWARISSPLAGPACSAADAVALSSSPSRSPVLGSASYSSPQSGDKRSRNAIAVINTSDSDGSERPPTPLEQRIERARQKRAPKASHTLDDCSAATQTRGDSQCITPASRRHMSEGQFKHLTLSPDSPGLPSPSMVLGWKFSSNKGMARQAELDPSVGSKSPGISKISWVSLENPGEGQVPRSPTNSTVSTASPVPSDSDQDVDLDASAYFDRKVTPDKPAGSFERPPLPGFAPPHATLKGTKRPADRLESLAGSTATYRTNSGAMVLDLDSPPPGPLQGFAAGTHETSLRSPSQALGRSKSYDDRAYSQSAVCRSHRRGQPAPLSRTISVSSEWDFLRSLVGDVDGEDELINELESASSFVSATDVAGADTRLDRLEMLGYLSSQGDESADLQLPTVSSQAITRKEVNKAQRQQKRRGGSSLQNNPMIWLLYCGQVRRKLEKERLQALRKANMSTVDKEALAKDMTVLLDYQLFAVSNNRNNGRPRVNGSGRDHGIATGGQEAEGSEPDIGLGDYASHPLLANLVENGVPFLVKQQRQARSVTWLRKIRKEWDDGTEMYVPLDEPRVEPVPDVLVIVPANEFVTAAIRSETLTFLREILDRVGCEGKLFLIIEGMCSYMKKQRNKESRQFAVMVRERLEQESQQQQQRSQPSRSRRALSEDTAVQYSDDEEFDGSQASSTAATRETGRRRKGRKAASVGANSVEAAAPAILTEDQLQDALVEMQIEYPNVHVLSMSGSPKEIARLLHQTTVDLAVAPLTKHRQSRLSDRLMMSMEAAKLRSGTDARDTWAKMLTQIPRVTPLVAKAIVNTYPTLRSLLDAWRRCIGSDSTGARGEVEGWDRATRILADIVVDRGQGAHLNKPVGEVLSRRIFMVFTERDAEWVIGG